MSARYDQEAIELCRKLYCKYGGKNHDAIQAEMQKVYGGWKKNLLHDRGKGKQARLGWITKYGFEGSLETHVKILVDSVNNDDQRDYLKLQEICKRLEEKAVDKDANRDDLYIYRDFFRLKLEMKTKLAVSRDNFETFADCWEKILMWTGDIDPKGAQILVKHSEKLLELAQAHYGKAEAFNVGADSGEDPGSDGPAAGKDIV